MEDCKHVRNKIAEVLFDKYGKKVAVLICCLKCGYEVKLKG